MKSALIIVDVQNDFLPGGALSVPEGTQILPVLNQLLAYPFDLIVASKDWHPANHCSFAANHPGKKIGDHIQIAGRDQILWPVHCVQNTAGAEFSPGWRSDKADEIIHKGTDKSIDSYSVFFDNDHLQSTGLENLLFKKEIENLFFAGLATEYCVKYSVLDAIKLGFNVCVIQDACRGIDPKESAKALEEMVKAGSGLRTTSQSPGQLRKI
jgi:nicotinamidase/pyrazinamidase